MAFDFKALRTYSSYAAFLEFLFWLEHHILLMLNDNLI